MNQLIQGRYYDYMFHALTNSSRYFKTSSDMSLGVYMAFNDLYVITPFVSKTQNAGFDGTGLCCQKITNMDNRTSLSYDYNAQVIDMGDGNEVELIEDDDTFLNCTKTLLDDFLVTDQSKKKQVEMLIVLSKIIGREYTTRLYQLLRRIKNGKK